MWQYILLLIVRQNVYLQIKYSLHSLCVLHSKIQSKYIFKVLYRIILNDTTCC